MPTTMHNTASGDGGCICTCTTHPAPSPTHTQTHMDVHSRKRTQAHTHAQTLMVMGHRAVYAHIRTKSLISVTARALAPKELANSCLAKAHPQ